jgi:hypothetical protein
MIEVSNAILNIIKCKFQCTSQTIWTENTTFSNVLKYQVSTVVLPKAFFNMDIYVFGERELHMQETHQPTFCVTKQRVIRPQNKE